MLYFATKTLILVFFIIVVPGPLVTGFFLHAHLLNLVDILNILGIG